MNNLMRWVAKSPSNERNVTTLITETYPMTPDDDNDTLEVATKEITENKSSLNEVMNNIRYDFVKILITDLMTYTEKQITRSEDLSFSQKLCFNTLLKENIIIELN